MRRFNLGRSAIRLLGWVFLTCASTAFAPPGWAQGTATLTSDKTDYVVGETAILTGTGFWPGEAVDVSLAITDLVTGEHVADMAWTVAVTDADGAFVTELVIPPEAELTLLTVTALGLQSALVASTTFTDGVSFHSVRMCTNLTFGVTANVSVSGFLEDFTPFSIWQETTSGVSAQCAPRWDVLCKSLVFYAFDPIVTDPVTGDVYEFVSAFPPSPFFAVGFFGCNAFNAARTVNATYVLLPGSPETNDPPVLSADDLELGELFGELIGTSFEQSLTVAPADFNPIPFDPDGDPVTLTLDQSAVTLVGPGETSKTLTLTATDDPTARDPLLTPESTAVAVTVSAQLVYFFDDFAGPLSTTKTRRVKTGATVPVKFALVDGMGAPICSDMGLGVPVVDVQFSQGNTPDGDPEITDAGSSNDDSNLCRIEGTCGVDLLWVYNLQTSKTDYEVGATYRVQIGLNDGTVHEAFISMK